MEQLPKCPKCGSEYTYEDAGLFICPECAHEWSQHEEQSSDTLEIFDANGTPLHDGDSVSVIKDLKIKGSSSTIKVGTKIKNIRLVESADGHNIDCKIQGIGALKITQKFVKKM
jgi:protein PhnA